MRRYYLPRLAAASLFLATTFILAACTSSVATSTKPTPTATPTPPPLTNATDVLSHMAAANLRDARVSITSVGTYPQGNISTMSTGAMTIQPSVMADFTTTGTYLGQSVNTREIVADDSVYVKDGTSTTWTKYPIDTAPNYLGFDISNITPAQLLLLTNTKLVGVETRNGLQVYHLQGAGTVDTGSLNLPNVTPTTSGEVGQSVAYTADLYVTIGTYQPVQLVAAANSNATTLNVTVNFTNWNQGVNITVPNSSVNG
jgi:hypothetical protein